MSDGELPEGYVEVARLSIIKTFTDDADGGSAIFVNYGDLSLVDALGMLAFAQATALDTFTREDDDDV